MNKLTNYFFEREDFKSPLFLSLLCFIVGIFFSRAVLSISIVFILLAGLQYYYEEKTLLINRFSIVFIPIYLMQLFSFFNSTNIDYWQNLSFKNLVFLILPVAFLFLKMPSNKIKARILNLYLALTLTSALINSIYAVYNYDLSSSLAINSKTLSPLIGSNYHDLSLIYALSTVFLLYRLLKKTHRNYIYQIAFWGLGICTYILSYRFAMVVFTICAISFFTFNFSNKNNNWIKLFILITIICLSTFYSPLINRVKTTLYDLKSIYSDVNPNYKSLGQRWAAVKCASEIIKNNPIFGVSSADLSTEMENQYEKNSYLLIPENRILIHNQYLYYAASFGFLGLFYFLGLIGFLIHRFIKSKQFLGLLILIVFLAHMLIENTLAYQIPSYLFLLTMLYFLNNPISVQKAAVSIVN